MVLGFSSDIIFLAHGFLNNSSKVIMNLISRHGFKIVKFNDFGEIVIVKIIKEFWVNKGDIITYIIFILIF
jgi:hypothetical protein